MAKGIKSEAPRYEDLFKVFKDVEKFPGSIYRKLEGKAESETLFDIVMDLKGLKANATVGTCGAGGAV